MRWSRAAMAAVVAATVAGCSTTVSGSVAQTTEPPGSGVDLASLDPGNYPTTPRPPLGNAGDARTGAIIEARRMAGYVVGPWEVDATMISSRISTGITLSADRLGMLLDDDEKSIGTAATAHGWVTGFASSRGSVDGNNWLLNIVFRFATPDDATAAAADMSAASASLKVPWTDAAVPHDPIPIPRYPDTAELVADTLDRQGPLIDQFQPTPVDQLADLPIDPDGLLARTLPNPPEDQRDGGDDLYDAHGQLHFDGEPIRSQGVFDAAGLQLVANGNANVYQTPDSASAGKIVDGFAAEMRDAKWAPAAGIEGLRGAQCLTQKGSAGHETSYYCVAGADRYAIEVSAYHEIEAHQLVAAQYLMLTSK